MRRAVALAAFLAASAQAALSGVFDIRTHDASAAGDTGLVRIECLLGDVTRYFRGALIDTGAATSTHEVVLTAAHGLPTSLGRLKRRCIVIGGTGVAIAIEDVWRPDSPGSVSANDWAVLLTEQRFRAPIARLRALRIDQDTRQRLAADETPVRLPLRSSEAERSCTLRRSELVEAGHADNLFAHSCRAWPGLSGSPILIGIDGESFVLGIHIGTRRALRGRAQVDVGRYLDATVTAAISAAVRRGREYDAEAEARRQRRERQLERLRVGTILR